MDVADADHPDECACSTTGMRLAGCGKTPCSPFDMLRANVGNADNQEVFPFVVSLSNHKLSFSAAC